MNATVFLVDDDAAVRDALRTLLMTEGFAVETYDSAEDFLARYRAADQPGCLVLDVRMPGLSGLELQKLLVERAINLPIIFLTGHGDIPMSVRALKAGAVDFLEKPADPSLLLARVREAIALDQRRRAAEANTAALRSRCARLTPREREVLVQVAAGKTSKEIARLLGISPRTVEVHRARIMEKLEAHSVLDLAACAAACGLPVPGQDPPA